MPISISAFYKSCLAWQYLSFHEITDNNKPQRERLLLNGGAACYNIYLTKDLRFIAIAPIEAKFWVTFCEAVSKPEWIERQSDSLPQSSLIREVSDLFKAESLNYWNEVFESVDCCYEPILMADEIAGHPQVIFRENLQGTNPRFAAWINDEPVDTSEEVQLADDGEVIKWQSRP